MFFFGSQVAASEEELPAPDMSTLLPENARIVPTPRASVLDSRRRTSAARSVSYTEDRDDGDAADEMEADAPSADAADVARRKQQSA